MSHTATRSAGPGQDHEEAVSVSAELIALTGQAGSNGSRGAESGGSPGRRPWRVGAVLVVLVLVVGAGVLALAGKLHLSFGDQSRPAAVALAPLLHRVTPTAATPAGKPHAGPPSVKIQMRKFGSSGASGSITLTRSGAKHFLIRTALFVPHGGFAAQLAAKHRTPRLLTRSSNAGALVYVGIVSAKQLRSYKTIDVTRPATRRGHARTGKPLLQTNIARAIARVPKRRG
jgi:hypothetical protein